MVHFRNFSSLAHAKMTLVKFKDFCVKLNLEIIFSQDKKNIFTKYLLRPHDGLHPKYDEDTLPGSSS